MPDFPKKISDKAFFNKMTGAEHWGKTTLTYSFNDGSDPGQSLNGTYQKWIKKALNEIEEIFGFKFKKVAGGGDIDFSGYDGGGTFAGISWNVPGNKITSVDIHIDRTWWANQPSELSYGSHGYTTILHELLHGFGLTHPSTYPKNASYFPDAEQLRDTKAYTVMSYFDPEDDGSGTSHWFKEGGIWILQYAQTPLLFDIEAMRRGDFDGKFGGYDANGSTRKSNTVYGYKAKKTGNDAFDFKANKAPIVTIVDGGGKDTLNLSGDKVMTRYEINYNGDNTVDYRVEMSRTDTIIDLREGKFSSTHGMDRNISIAKGSRIENAVGTKFDDVMTGNKLNNKLKGLGGDDTLDGMKGNDKLYGQAGEDTFVYKKKYDADHIYGFQDGSDSIALSQKLWKGKLNANQVLDKFGSMQGADAVLDFGKGNTLTIHKTQLAELQDDIVFA